MTARQPVLFLSHGSPMTALGGDELSQVWTTLSARLSKPSAVLMVSAHWNSSQPTVGGSPQPETIYDFGGFPDELYQLRYPAPGAPDLAQRIQQQLTDAGMASDIDSKRGLDHGAWVPLRVLFPAADIPVLQLSVQPDRSAHHHHSLGAALAPLAEENILIIASGHMTHNLREYMRGKPFAEETRAFRNWTHAHLMAGDTEPLLDWQDSAPNVAFAHPTVEHFLPLFVALGAAGPEHTTEWLGGGWVANLLAADNYLFEQRTVPQKNS